MLKKLLKRSAEPKPEPAIDYYNWDGESLVNTFHTCTCGQRSSIVKVMPAPVGQQTPIPLCPRCDIADRMSG
jgi:hypothetical protein